MLYFSVRTEKLPNNHFYTFLAYHRDNTKTQLSSACSEIYVLTHISTL